MTTLEHPDPEVKAAPRETFTAPPTSSLRKEAPSLRRELTEDQICILTFDRPGSSANIFDLATLTELSEVIESLEHDTQVRGLVLVSAKKGIFIAGADLHSLSEGASPEKLRSLIELGQSVFSRVAALGIPTVAAIHGACVGGGYELCLACQLRLASPDRATRIGLPETQLGILPAWGGATRLPRLVGLPKALDVILSGKVLPAKAALKRGLVDELVPKEYLVELACRRIRQGLRKRSQPRLQDSRLVAAALRLHLRSSVLKKTRGHYPAILTALRVVTRGITTSVEKSLALEREAILELARTEACKNLLGLFFMQERAKKLGAPASEAKAGARAESVRKLTVIGAGVMGAGIAQWASARDLRVVLRDVNPEQVGKGMANIARLYAEGAKRRVFTREEARAGLDRIYPSATEIPLTNIDLVVEAAVEKMDLKQQLFARLDELAGPGTILATNTSALSISEIATATRHPERVIGIHFFNPVHRMQLVEVVVGRQTAPEVLQRSLRFVQQIGKLPVVVRDSPGFLVNRILMPYLIEAGHLFESGAGVQDIDEAMLEFGMPMGPLRLIDEVGVDVANHVAETIAAHFSERLRAPEVLPRLLQAGWLGRKSGRGFYLHTKGRKDAKVNPDLTPYRRDALALALTRDGLRRRMVLLMVNEAAHCLEEGVVERATEVDFGMILGTGFAPFRGGPLRYADSVGVSRMVEQMNELAATGEPRFAPCRLLQEMAADDKKFYEEPARAAGEIRNS